MWERGEASKLDRVEKALRCVWRVSRIKGKVKKTSESSRVVGLETVAIEADRRQRWR